MPGVVLPPYASPTGPELSRERLVDAFLEGARTGFSEELHIEDDMLLAERMLPFGIRVGTASLLIRGDVPSDVVGLKEMVEADLTARGLRAVEPDARLGDIAAIQVTGVRGGVWDLWGRDPGEAHGQLERAVLGDDAAAMSPGISSIDDSAVGMTLEDLLGEGPGEGSDRSS